MAKLLMCEPTHYGIEYEINPWMSRRRPADVGRAALQWTKLYETLKVQPGVAVELVPPVSGLPDLVFSANAGFVYDGIFVRSNFRYAERAPEEPVWTSWFAGAGYQALVMPHSQKFEGEGDALMSGGVVYAGWRFRSHRASHITLARLTGLPVVSLKLADPYFYHLDTCFAPLGAGRVMYFPPAFSPESRRRIERDFPERLEINEDEARNFVCNAVVLGRTVVTSAGCPVTEAALSTWGYRVIPLETSEFVKSGGSAKCMVLFLERDPSP